MYIIFGTKGSWLEVRPETISLHTHKSSFLRSYEETTHVTLPISAMIDVVFVKPSLFKKGWISFIFGENESTHTMGVQSRNKNRVESLYHILKNRIHTSK